MIKLLILLYELTKISKEIDNQIQTSSFYINQHNQNVELSPGGFDDGNNNSIINFTNSKIII
jgi:hypothetical protein